MEFQHFVQLIALGLQAPVPMHMTGFPGVGKTEITKSLEVGFAYGLGAGRAAPRRGGYLVVIFLDEPTTVPHIPTSAARTLCDRRNRPEGPMKLPEECRPFYDLMQMAKLVPRE